MNYLAHLFLAPDDPEQLAGNLAGDFVKGRLSEAWSAGLRAGIAQHRRIDEFTDTNADVAAMRRVIAAEQGHYARIITDVFFDHFLARDWRRYSEESLEEFLTRVFRNLDGQQHLFPDRLRAVYPRMRDERWLLSYRHVPGIETALRNLSRRLSRTPRMETAVHFLVDRNEELTAGFRVFFPQVIEFAHSKIRAQ